MVWDDSGSGISLLVPYRPDGAPRTENWEWLQRYWRAQLPGAQICVGDDGGEPFSRAGSLNTAAEKATGDIFVVMDADWYYSPQILKQASYALGTASPWLRAANAAYYLKKGVTQDRLRADPAAKYDDSLLSQPYCWKQPDVSFEIMYRYVWETIGGMDERFRGWGGEDISFRSCLSTMFGEQQTPLPNAVIHMWHPGTRDPGYTKTLRGRLRSLRTPWYSNADMERNQRLADKYREGWGNPYVIRKLLEQRDELRARTSPA